MWWHKLLLPDTYYFLQMHKNKHKKIYFFLTPDEMILLFNVIVSYLDIRWFAVSFLTLVFLIFSPRFQKEGVQGKAGDRHHSQLHQQEHHCGSQSRGDQWRGVHLQPEILPGSERGNRWERSTTQLSSSSTETFFFFLLLLLWLLCFQSLTTDEQICVMALVKQQLQKCFIPFLARPPQVLIWRTSCTTETTLITLSWLPRNRACWIKVSSLM